MRFARTANPDKLYSDNIRFDSIAEREVYDGLKLLFRAGSIRALQYHTKFHFKINGIDIGDYESDFTYIDDHGTTHVLDVKGWKMKRGVLVPRLTEEFRLKRNLMRACFGLDVELV